MKQKIISILLNTTILLSLLSGCGNAHSASLESAIIIANETDELLTEPENSVIETDFGSYTCIKENADFPSALEDVEISINDTVIQLSLPKDMGVSFHYDENTNSLFIFNEDKSKMGFLYFSDFLQGEAYKTAYDTETFSNVITYDGFLTSATEVTTLKDEDSLIVQHIPAIIKAQTGNEYIQNTYIGELLRYQTYQTEAITLTDENNISGAAYPGRKYLFFYGENTFSSYFDYIVESFSVSEASTGDSFDLAADISINDFLLENTNFANEEILLQTSYLHSFASISEELLWQSYIDLGLYRTQVTDDMTLEEIQEAIKKSCVAISFCFEDEFDGGYKIDTSDASYGSGYVIDIDENFLYVATNWHVADTGSSTKGGEHGYQIRFCKNYKEKNSLIFHSHAYAYIVGHTSNPDYAILKCDISTIPYADRYWFKTIPQIKDVELTQGMPVYMYHLVPNHFSSLKNGSLYSTEKIMGFDGTMSYYTSDISIGGDSGSLFFTQQGQCLGMLVGSMTINNTLPYYSVIIPYDLIPTTFEKIVGRPLYDELSLKDLFIQYISKY